MARKRVCPTDVFAESNATCAEREAKKQSEYSLEFLLQSEKPTLGAEPVNVKSTHVSHKTKLETCNAPVGYTMVSIFALICDY